MIARIVPAREASVHDAATLSGRLLALAQSQRSIWCSAITTRGPAVLLGARQRRSSVLDEARCTERGVPVERRLTTGAHVFIGPSGAAVFSIALPSIDALVNDARPATVLNRNVRGWLSALTRAGAIASYFGRDWLSIARRPCGALALRCVSSGAVAIELWLGARESTALPPELATDLERSTDRWLKKSPASYFDCAKVSVMDLAWCDQTQRRALERYSVAVEPQPLSALEVESTVESTDDPWAKEPEALRWSAPTPCAIGSIESAITQQNTVWIGGDTLISDAAVAALSEALTDSAERAERVAKIVASEIVLGADAEAWLRCGAALDSVVRSAPL